MARNSSASACCWSGTVQSERRHPGVEGSLLAGEKIGATVEDGDGDRRLRGCALRAFAQVALGLDGDHLVDGGRVVREVRAAAGADLDHPAAQAASIL